MDGDKVKIHCAYDKLVKIDEIKPNPANPNNHPPEQIERLTRIIAYSGVRQPLKVSKQSGMLTAGHGRLMAFKRLKMKLVPVDYQDYETPEQEIADLHADNAIAQWANIDMAATLELIKSVGPFDLDMMGFKDFRFEPPANMVETVNKGSELDEWAQGMPDFKPGDDYIKLVYIFSSKEELEKFVYDNNINVKTKLKNSWLVYP